jgi:hypothetical protein
MAPQALPVIVLVAEVFFKATQLASTKMTPTDSPAAALFNTVGTALAAWFPIKV